MRRIGALLVPYLAAAAGVVGFGLLFRGAAAGNLAGALTGLALILLGLDRAGRALAASFALHAGAARGGGQAAATARERGEAAAAQGAGAPTPGGGWALAAGEEPAAGAPAHEAGTDAGGRR